MTDFVLIDLRSQADAVWDYVNEWTKEEILVWLSKRGNVTLLPNYTDSYQFCSKIGIETLFRLTQDHKFFIYLGDHVFYKPSNQH